MIGVLKNLENAVRILFFSSEKAVKDLHYSSIISSWRALAWPGLALAWLAYTNTVPV